MVWAKMTQNEANLLNDEILSTEARWNAQVKSLVGKRVRVLSEYNGQMYGRSKTSLKGQIKKIGSAMIGDEGIIISLEGYVYGCPCLELSEVEILNNEN